MRIKYAKLLTFFIIFTNILIFYYSWKYFISFNLNLEVETTPPQSPAQLKAQKPKDRIQMANKHMKKSLTIVFRDFYHFENDLKQSIVSIMNLIPNIKILVITDDIPYPPLDFSLNDIHSSRNITNNDIFKNNNVHFMTLNYDVTKSVRDFYPLLQIKTRYVLFLPDSVRLNGRSVVNRMLREISNNDLMDIKADQKQNMKQEDKIVRNLFTYNKMTNRVIVVPFASNVKTLNNCCDISLDFPNWAIEYLSKNGTDHCDMFLQKHAIMVETSLLKDIPDPLSAPFPELFYIQAKVFNTKKIYLNVTLQDGKRLFTSYHSKTKRKEMRKEQFKLFYRKLQIKKVIRHMQQVHLFSPPNGGGGTGGHMMNNINKMNNKNNKKRRGGGEKGHKKSNNNKNDNLENAVNAEANVNRNGMGSITYNNSLGSVFTTETRYYGCEKNTKSCIGQVFNAKPFYMYLGKHTPPCCMEKLKAVLHHVIEELENVGIRYWLDNLALKSAIEINSVSVDAYEIDVSFNLHDLERSNALVKSQIRPFADDQGFYWIKATDGHYFKVQFSKINQIGVNLLPFDILADKVKPNGFYGWKAKEFSSDYLHPMSTVLFLGKNILCPNNVREYLEMKKLQ